LARGTTLAEVETPNQERPAGATETESEVRGKILEFAWWLKKRGCSETTIIVWVSTLKSLIALGANLSDPESVKETIANAKCLQHKVGKPWSESRKQAAATTYTAFLRMQGKTWESPSYEAARKLPFIPTEQELDSLIAGCGKRTATFLQLLKETGMRCGEAVRMKWIDVDFERSIITLNSPEKHGNPRMFKVSTKLLSMLSALPKVNEKVFPVERPTHVRTTFYASRKRLALKLQNPRLMRIGFHTFRHWKATMLYHQTKDIVYVKEFLGHRKLDTTLLYIQVEKALFEETSDEFTVRITQKPEEIKELLEVGFQYVCEKDGLMFFRKRK
jgi:integrase